MVPTSGKQWVVFLHTGDFVVALEGANKEVVKQFKSVLIKNLRIKCFLFS